VTGVTGVTGVIEVTGVTEVMMAVAKSFLLLLYRRCERLYHMLQTQTVAMVDR